MPLVGDPYHHVRSAAPRADARVEVGHEAEGHDLAEIVGNSVFSLVIVVLVEVEEANVGPEVH